jgi:hypothetical protein
VCDCKLHFREIIPITFSIFPLPSTDPIWPTFKDSILNLPYTEVAISATEAIMSNPKNKSRKFPTSKPFSICMFPYTTYRTTLPTLWLDILVREITLCRVMNRTVPRYSRAIFVTCFAGRTQSGAHSRDGFCVRLIRDISRDWARSITELRK